MFEPQLSPLVAASITEAVGRSADLTQALDSIVNDLFFTVGTRALIVARRGTAWTPIVGIGEGNRAWSASVDGITFLPGGRVARVMGAGYGAFNSS